MSLSSILRAIITGLVAIFAFILTMLVLAYTLNLEQYSLVDLANKLGGIHVFAAVIIAFMASSYFIYWSIEDSLKRNVKEYTEELVANLKRINNELTIAYELIKEVNAKIQNNDEANKELRERIIALEKLVVEALEKSK
ncbi:MAG TPA: hypothetical protein VKU94_05290 [Geobacterales bacterium]|nr:hypothetical protein [Geobacterales bacterium]